MSHEPALRPDLAVGETLLAVARHILAEARTAIEDPGKPDSKAVHDFRRQMKRWPRAVPVCAYGRAILPVRSGARATRNRRLMHSWT